MSNYVDEEFNRILTNPENEIISDSLKDRLSNEVLSSNISVEFSDKKFEANLDSFSINPLENEISRISLVLKSDAVWSLISSKEFIIKSDELNIYIESKKLEAINCFRYDKDTYILEALASNKEVLND